MSLDIEIVADRPVVVFETNITHNLVEMARAAGLYDCMWGAKGKRAGDLIEPLRRGLQCMCAFPSLYIGLEPGNGWGTYEDLRTTARKFLAACRENEDGRIHTCG